jgi:hypothetical protein
MARGGGSRERWLLWNPVKKELPGIRFLSALNQTAAAQTEENIAQSHMRPTQSGKRMSQGLRDVRQAVCIAAIHPR